MHELVEWLEIAKAGLDDAQELLSVLVPVALGLGGVEARKCLGWRRTVQRHDAQALRGATHLEKDEQLHYAP